MLGVGLQKGHSPCLREAAGGDGPGQQCLARGYRTAEETPGEGWSFHLQGNSGGLENLIRSWNLKTLKSQLVQVREAVSLSSGRAESMAYLGLLNLCSPWKVKLGSISSREDKLFHLLSSSLWGSWGPQGHSPCSSHAAPSQETLWASPQWGRGRWWLVLIPHSHLSESHPSGSSHFLAGYHQWGSCFSWKPSEGPLSPTKDFCLQNRAALLACLLCIMTILISSYGNTRFRNAVT